MPLLLEIGFDGRREAVWAEPWALSGPAGAVAAAQRASQQPPPPDRARRLKIVAKSGICGTELN